MKVVIPQTIENETGGDKLRRNCMCLSQVLAKISINCREKRIVRPRRAVGSAVLSGRPALAHVADALRQRTLQRLARTKCPENPEQPNIVSVAKQRADIDKLSITDLMKRRRNFFFLGCSEELGVFGEFAELDSRGEMTVNGAGHKTSGTRDFID